MEKVLSNTVTSRSLYDIEREDPEYANELGLLLVKKLHKYALVKQLMAQYEKTLIIEIDNEFAGFFVLANRTGETKFKGVPILKLAYLKEEFRHQGYWNQALQLLEDFALAKGFDGIAVFSDIKSLPLFVISGFESMFAVNKGGYYRSTFAEDGIDKWFINYRNTCRWLELSSALSRKNPSDPCYGDMEKEFKHPKEFRSEYFHEMVCKYSGKMNNAIKRKNEKEISLYMDILNVLDDNLLMERVKGQDILLIKMLT